MTTLFPVVCILGGMVMGYFLTMLWVFRKMNQLYRERMELNVMGYDPYFTAFRDLTRKIGGEYR